MGKWVASALLAAGYLVVTTHGAGAHDGAPVAPHDLSAAWNWEWPLVEGLPLMAGV
jgi:hypothetical protein